jgi:uncharacterized membrane protein YphA (DoxX/SURF4 family)
MSFLRNPWLGLFTRLLVGGVFVYASVDKILHPEQFARIIFNYHLVPAPWINLAALVLPCVECLAGLFLIFGIWPKSAGLILTSLTLVFIVALAVNWVRGVSLECGCFTVSSKAKGAIGSLIVRDVLLLLAGLQTTLLAPPKAWLAPRE